jgi:chloramphenicol 3-O-phosphotransferase
VEIQLAKYILIGPFLIESSALATLIVVVVAVLLFVSIEVIMRRRAKRSDRES